MLCLSVQQPWAWAIISGIKQIENRTWTTSYRGPLLIHAGKSRLRLWPGMENEFEGFPGVDRLAFGAIIGRVELIDCVPLSAVARHRFAEGPYCWLFRDAKAFGPIPWSGKQGLFHVNLP